MTTSEHGAAAQAIFTFNPGFQELALEEMRRAGVGSDNAPQNLAQGVLHAAVLKLLREKLLDLMLD